VFSYPVKIYWYKTVPGRITAIVIEAFLSSTKMMSN